MAIPEFQAIMLPLPELANEAGEHTVYETRDRLADLGEELVVK